MKRITRVVLCLLLILLILQPLARSVSAASSPVTVAEGGITFSFSNSGIYNFSSHKNTGSAEVSGDNKIVYTNNIPATCAKMSYSFTITNSSGVKAEISFNWSRSNFDEFSLEGNSGTSGTVTKTMAAGESITFSATSKCTSSQKDTLTLSNITLTPNTDVDVSVYFDSGLGSVKVGDPLATITSGTQVTAVNGTLMVEATAGTNNKFLGWINDDTNVILPVASDGTLTIEAGVSKIRAVFANDSTGTDNTPWFSVGGTYLVDTLGTAIGKVASTSDKTIILMNNSTLSAGTYTIPSGVTLLIPFDDAHTLITDNMEDHYSSESPVPDKTLYCQLKMNTGAHIVVNGGLSVGSRANRQMIGQVGPYGAIVMDSGSSITVGSGGGLYTWGYIFPGSNGGGTVSVNSGGVVHEILTIMDYPGSADLTQTLYLENGIFPMRAYTVRNVEVPMTLVYGAKEYAFYCFYGENVLIGYNPNTVLFVGNAEEDGVPPVFKLDSSDATVEKSYSSGKQYITFSGSCSINPMVVNIKRITTVSTSDTTGIPLPSGFQVRVSSGTLSCNESIIMMEGTKLTVDHGAIINIGNQDIFLLAAADDPGAVSMADVHGTSYTKVETNAVVDINGTIICGSGFFTSAGKADVISSEGTGSIQLNATPNTEGIDLKFKYSTATAQERHFEPIFLKNADSTYVSTAEGGNGTYTYYASTGRWDRPSHFYEDVVTAPTCTEKGYTTHTCAVCGDSYTDTEVAATGHTSVTDAAVAPTCTETGLTEGSHCSVCNAVLVAQEEVPALDHEYDAGVVTAPTCTEEGYTTYTCTRTNCGHSYTANKVAATGHTSVTDAAVAPTCTETGLTEGSHCSVCTAVITAQEEVAALGHTEVIDEAVAATCTETGLTEGAHCSVCTAVITAQEEVAALGHDEFDLVAVPPTCTETGLTAGTGCSTCGETLVAQEEVAATGHTPGAAATCTTDQTCTVCDAVVNEAPGDPHQWAAGVEAAGICDVCKSKFEFHFVNMAVREGLDLYFYVKVSDVEGLEDQLICRFSKEFADDRGTEVTDVAEPEKFKHDGVDYYRYCFSDISAKEMLDNITGQIVYADSGAAASFDYTECVHDHIIDLYKTYKDNESYAYRDQLLRTIADLLNYGANCQIHFKYGNLDQDGDYILANNTGDENETKLMTYATTETPAYETALTEGEYLYGTAFSAKNKLMFTFFFDFEANENGEIGIAGLDLDKITAVASYTIDGETVEKTLDRKAWFLYKQGDKYLYGIDVEGITLLNGRTPITLTLTQEGAAEPISVSTDSIPSYTARATSKQTLYDTMLALLKCIDSAARYLTNS